ncbi:MAG: amidohydrolase family protein [Pseudomonadota bacterium]
MIQLTPHGDDDVPFIDCHHHIWEPHNTSHPWLTQEPQIPFRYGDYSAIRGPYLPEHYLRDIGEHRVAAHVTMEGEWDPSDPVGETRWLAGVFTSAPDYLGHVARAFLHHADVQTILEGHAAYPFVKGIRHKPTAAASPDTIEHGTPGGLTDPAWRRGYALLAQYGLHFELQAPWWHAHELLDLIAQCPETPIVINHAFLPADRSDAALSGWRSALRLAATAPNVMLKISGIGLPDRTWSLDDNAAIISDCLDAFGVDRCVFASNFPVDRLCGTFETIIGGYKQATAHLPTSDRRKLFCDNAAGIYRLDLQSIASE